MRLDSSLHYPTGHSMANCDASERDDGSTPTSSDAVSPFEERQCTKPVASKTKVTLSVVISRLLSLIPSNQINGKTTQLKVLECTYNFLQQLLTANAKYTSQLEQCVSHLQEIEKLKTSVDVLEKRCACYESIIQNSSEVANPTKQNAATVPKQSKQPDAVAVKTDVPEKPCVLVYSPRIGGGRRKRQSEAFSSVLNCRHILPKVCNVLPKSNVGNTVAADADCCSTNEQKKEVTEGVVQRNGSHPTALMIEGSKESAMVVDNDNMVNDHFNPAEVSPILDNCTAVEELAKTVVHNGSAVMPNTADSDKRPGHSVASLLSLTADLADVPMDSFGDMLRNEKQASTVVFVPTQLEDQMRADVLIPTSPVVAATAKSVACNSDAAATVSPNCDSQASLENYNPQTLSTFHYQMPPNGDAFNFAPGRSAFPSIDSLISDQYYPTVSYSQDSVPAVTKSKQPTNFSVEYLQHTSVNCTQELAQPSAVYYPYTGYNDKVADCTGSRNCNFAKANNAWCDEAQSWHRSDLCEANANSGVHFANGAIPAMNGVATRPMENTSMENAEYGPPRVGPRAQQFHIESMLPEVFNQDSGTPLQINNTRPPQPAAVSNTFPWLNVAPPYHHLTATSRPHVLFGADMMSVAMQTSTANFFPRSSTLQQTSIYDAQQQQYFFAGEHLLPGFNGVDASECLT